VTGSSSTRWRGWPCASSRVRANSSTGPARTGPWRTVWNVELATLSWVNWRNTSRLHGYLDDEPSPEFEATFYAANRIDQPPGRNPIARASIRSPSEAGRFTTYMAASHDFGIDPERLELWIPNRASAKGHDGDVVPLFRKPKGLSWCRTRPTNDGHAGGRPRPDGAMSSALAAHQ
jgi:hypothetical protein